jgi:hypothetical protein
MERVFLISVGGAMLALISAGHQGALISLGTTNRARAPSSLARRTAKWMSHAGGKMNAVSLCSFPHRPHTAQFQSCLVRASTPSLPNSGNLDHQRPVMARPAEANRSTVASSPSDISRAFAISYSSGVAKGPGSAAMLSLSSRPASDSLTPGGRTFMYFGRMSWAKHRRLHSTASICLLAADDAPFASASCAAPSKPRITTT